MRSRKPLLPSLSAWAMSAAKRCGTTLVIYDLAVSLLVPPIGFAVLAMAALAGRLARHPGARRAALALQALALAALLVLAMPVTAASLLVGLERGLPLAPPADAPPQAIVVLGGDMARSQPPGPGYAPGPLSLERERAAARLARRTGLPLLTTGGSLAPGAPPIGGLMAGELATDFDTPVRWVEPAARDTWENAALSAAMLRREGIGSVYVVTQAWHMPRAMIAFRHAGLRMTAAPTRFDRVSTSRLLDFIPSAEAWITSYYAFHEWIGCVVYRFRG